MILTQKLLPSFARFQNRESSETRDSQPVRKNSFVKALVVLELLHVVLFLGFHGSSQILQHSINPKDELNSYFGLFEYNTVKIFFGDWRKMSLTTESEKLLLQIQETDGIVAVDTQWAVQHGYAPTVTHPYDDSKSIYQIDMFHSMHCIHRIRNKLTSELSLQEWRRNDEHTLHCLDYLREQLMCNADLTLEGTDDFLHFNKTSGHVCRNYDAIMEWAKDHHWAGHREFVTKTLGYE